MPGEDAYTEPLPALSAKGSQQSPLPSPCPLTLRPQRRTHPPPPCSLCSLPLTPRELTHQGRRLGLRHIEEQPPHVQQGPPEGQSQAEGGEPSSGARESNAQGQMGGAMSSGAMRNNCMGQTRL